MADVPAWQHSTEDPLLLGPVDPGPQVCGNILRRVLTWDAPKAALLDAAVVRGHSCGGQTVLVLQGSNTHQCTGCLGLTCLVPQCCRMQGAPATTSTPSLIRRWAGFAASTCRNGYLSYVATDNLSHEVWRERQRHLLA